MDNTVEQKREFVGFITFFYMIPIMLLYFGIIPFNAFYGILVMMGLILVAYSINQNISASELGFVRKNLVPAIKYAIPVTLIGVAVMLLASYFNLYEKTDNHATILFYLFYMLISAPIQEFIFRSLMLHELKLFFKKNKIILIFISALLFSFAHIFFRNLGVLAGTFVLGVIWAWIFEHRPNFWAVWFSHAVIGAVAIGLQFI